MGGTLADLIHPRELGVFQLIQGLVLGGSTGVSLVADVLLIAGESLFEPPVVGEPCGAGVLAQMGLLNIGGIEFITVRFFDEHKRIFQGHDSTVTGSNREFSGINGSKRYKNSQQLITLLSNKTHEEIS